MENRLARLIAITDRFPDWAIAAAFLFVLTVLMFARVLFRPWLMVAGSDFVQFYFWENFAREELAAGRLPLWNPYFFSGYPALANPQTMTFYPPAMALRLLPLGYSFGVGIALHVWWAGVGAYVLGRHIGLSRFSALIVAVAFMFSGFIMPRVEAGHLDILYSVAWLPWAVWVWARLLNDKAWQWMAGTVVVMSLQFLAGFPTVSLLTSIMLGAVTAEWCVHAIRRQAWSVFGCGLARAIAAVALTLGFTAPQLLPTMEFTRLSTRSAGLSLECARPLALKLADFATLALPQTPFDLFLAWERTMYFGALAFVASLIALISAGRFNRWHGKLAVIAATGVLFGAGPNLPFYSAAHQWLPVFSYFRVPAQFGLLVCFAGALLAGVGFDQMAEWARAEDSRRRWPILLALGFLLIGIVPDAVLLYEGSARQFALSPFGQLSTARYLIVAVVSFLLGYSGHRKPPLVLAVAFLFGDLWLFGNSHIIVSSEITYRDRATGAPAINAAQARIFTHPYMHADALMLTRTANAQGYAPMVLSSYAAFALGGTLPEACASLEHAEIDPADMQLLRSLSVKYIAGIGTMPEEISDYYPRALWVGSAKAAADSAEAIAVARSPDFDPSRVIYVEGLDADELMPPADGDASAQITSYEPQRVTIMVNAPSAGWLLLNDVWYPGWQAAVNGKATPIYRANGTFRAVRVPAGSSVVTMTYHSTYLSLGLWTAAVTWSGVILVVLARTVLRRVVK